ncbi:type I restriction enzyme HsdR N-terminal domain-containing protein [Luteolibacter pohnpeiensis]|uniref:Type I restriction enzyme HsdR N-terminal domain-containing protein n=1 Tax=Luteolibacter pohnpeiensis TaxID=454153 RepID=A0A934S6I2_9BACT|nr:type I restriction enzyme HsdR N-terminal domain-containing protein [Luteolibacter pohnpeiensis]MBK1883541.1 type I restriction enzyme HsdR N-terminal domain-containing protein [Luteolibacter pohnpeiensis]
MDLHPTIEDITAKLRQGRFPNEQSISQGIVLRLLQVLGWDVYDTNVVWPEFQTGEGRVDFALCHPPSKPAVFIEVKQPGKAEDGVRQALEYAFHTGVPFIVLTDGKTWSFYLPAERGSYEDRRVYKLDLFERATEQAATVLAKYLHKPRVETGSALEDAIREYRNRNRQKEAKQAIPEAWRELVEKGDELLVALVADAVESKAGVRPEDDDIFDFLIGLHGGYVPVTGNGPVAPKQPTKPPTGPGFPVVPAMNKQKAPRQGQLLIKGKAFGYSNAKDAMVIVLTELSKGDPTFLQRCSQHPDCSGRKRRYIAQSLEDMYPDRPDLREMHEVLSGGWMVATNLNNALKKSIIRAATEVAGLHFGSDITVDF